MCPQWPSNDCGLLAAARLALLVLGEAPPERVSLAEEALVSDEMQAWFESRDVFACSLTVVEKSRATGGRFPLADEGLVAGLLSAGGRPADQLVVVLPAG